jgi:hypothetical protein
LLLQKNAAFRDNDGDIAINKALALVVGERNSNVRVFDADVQRNAKDATFWLSYTSYQPSKLPDQSALVGQRETLVRV